MSRFRAFAAVFACLAILAGALNVASASQGYMAADRSTVATPCSDCDDCDKSPCPMSMADCIQMHSNSSAGLVAASLDLWAAVYIAVQWSSAHTTLSGLSPPPDPLPPRA
jgi:hypothetical protein